MLDYADLVAINKYEKRGGEDALRDVRKQVQRNRKHWDTTPEEMPVFGTIASQFNDDGVTALYRALLEAVSTKTGRHWQSRLAKPAGRVSSSKTIIIPPARTRYLAEVSETVRAYHRQSAEQAAAVRTHWHLTETVKTLAGEQAEAKADTERLITRLQAEIEAAHNRIGAETHGLLAEWEAIRQAYNRQELVYRVRGRNCACR